MGHTAAYYAPLWATREGRLEFLREATSLVDPQVNFASYDTLYIVAPEALAGTLGLSLERPWPDEAVVRDGKPLMFTVMGGAGLDPRGPTTNLAAHHIVTHETGHFLGLPDLYDQAHRGTPEQFSWAGRWDIMSDNRASSHMFAWHKWLLGWLDPAQLRGLTSPGSTEAELTPLERKSGLKAVVVPISPSSHTSSRTASGSARTSSCATRACSSGSWTRAKPTCKGTRSCRRPAIRTATRAARSMTPRTTSGPVRSPPSRTREFGWRSSRRPRLAAIACG